MFKIGQKVICVDDHFPRLKSVGIICPIRKRIYTIRDVVPSLTNNGVSYLLEDIDNSAFARLTRAKREPAFYPKHFAPATYLTNETSEIAKRILEECPVVEEVLDAIMEEEEILIRK